MNEVVQNLINIERQITGINTGNAFADDKRIFLFDAGRILLVLACIVIKNVLVEVMARAAKTYPSKDILEGIILVLWCVGFAIAMWIFAILASDHPSLRAGTYYWRSF